MIPFVLSYRSQYWYGDPYGRSSLSNFIITANRLYLVPFVCFAQRQFDALGSFFSSASGNIRMGVYSMREDQSVGGLIAETASTSCGTSTTATIHCTLTPGQYFLAMVSDGTPTAWALRQIIDVYTLGFSTANDTSPVFGYYVAHTYGALPRAVTASLTSLTSVTACPSLRIRAK